MARVHHYRPAEHRSRREIDLATGALMGIRRLSAEEAWSVIVGVVRASGVGPGEVSRALLNVITGDIETAASKQATTHWNRVLSLPAQTVTSTMTGP